MNTPPSGADAKAASLPQLEVEVWIYNDVSTWLVLEQNVKTWQNDQHGLPPPGTAAEAYQRRRRRRTWRP